MLRGKLSELPSHFPIMQIVLGEHEVCQSFQEDVQGAFYLYSVPDEWLALTCLSLPAWLPDEHGVVDYRYVGLKVVPIPWVG